jgi:SAM-dependent methyltransferase
VLANNSETTNGGTRPFDPCPLCQDLSSVTHLRNWHEYELLYCRACQFRFSSPMKDPDETFYREHVLYDDRVRDRTTTRPSVDWRYETFLRLCRTEQPKTLLDIGCGEGGFMALAQRQGFVVSGLDLDERAVTYAKTRHHLERVACARWERLHTMGDWKEFDVITLFETLEHVASPVSLMETVYGLLKSGGSVVITVPRFDRWPPLFDPSVDCPPHHLSLWTANALTTLMQQSGFDRIRVIRKPLAADDILMHLRWRVRRFISRHRPKARGEGYDTSSHWERSATDEHPLSLPLITTAVHGVLTACVWFLSLTRVARGHTLLAMATRPY